MRKLSLILLALTVLVSPLFGNAQNQKQEHEDLFYTANDSQIMREEKTRNLLNAAIVYYLNHPLEEAFKALNDRDGVFVRKYTYGFRGVNVMTKQGTFLVTPVYPKLIGYNGLAWQSPEGRYTHLEIIKASEANPEGAMTLPVVGNNNPFTGKPSAHRFFVRVVDDLIFFSSIYDDAELHKEFKDPENIKTYQKID